MWVMTCESIAAKYNLWPEEVYARIAGLDRVEPWLFSLFDWYREPLKYYQQTHTTGKHNGSAQR